MDNVEITARDFGLPESIIQEEKVNFNSGNYYYPNNVTYSISSTSTSFYFSPTSSFFPEHCCFYSFVGHNLIFIFN